LAYAYAGSNPALSTRMQDSDWLTKAGEAERTGRV
jgi:hypothetical protein